MSISVSLKFVLISKEHGHLQADDKPNLKVGDKLQVIPNHVCTCVNMHEYLNIIEGDQVVFEWRIACRGKLR